MSLRTNTSQSTQAGTDREQETPETERKQSTKTMGKRSGAGAKEAAAAAGAREFGSMEEFWGFYLGQHSKPATRRWHFAGTLASLGCAVLAAATGRGAPLLAAPVLGYGMAWYSHFFVEGNRPATFGHPVWSLLCDYRMFALILAGRIDAELARLRIRPPSQRQD